MDTTTTPSFSIPLLAWIPLLPLLGAFVNLTIGRRMPKAFVTFIALGSVIFAFVIAAYMVFSNGQLHGLFESGHGGEGVFAPVYTWIEVGSFKAELAFRLDTLSAVMILIITFIGSLIHIYSTGYMAHDPRYTAFFGYLNLFTGSMLILVLAANMPVMFIGWEGVGLCSFLLIGFWYENEAFASAGRKAFVVNRIGDFAFLLGMFFLFWATKDHQSANGSLDFALLKDTTAVGSAYVAPDPIWGREHFAAIAGILLFIGACGKSAQIPLYVWLPDAMAGPTPVSALIHAATMVTAGVYMVCRLGFLYASSTTALIVVSTVGMLTALAAAFMAFAQTDLKKVLAYSTVSQLGFMFVAAGTGNYTAAIFHVGTHAFFKACLFLGAGSIMHALEHEGSHTPGDIMTMGGLRRRLPLTHITFMISCLAIAGIVPFAGFFSKDDILAGAFNFHAPGAPEWYGKMLWAGTSIAALGTAFYMWRLYFLVFAGEGRSEPAKHAHESPFNMTGPLIVLAFFATVIGFIGFPELASLEHAPKFLHALPEWLGPSLAHDWYDPTATGIHPIAGHESDGLTLGLMAIALVVGIAGIVIAYLFYGRGPSKTVAKLVDGPLGGVYEASKNKLWVDEAYGVVFVKPFKILARGLFEIADRFVIDTVAVNGAAFVVGIVGRISRWFQNGNVQRYLVGVVVGGALVFAVTQCHHKPTFTYKIVGNQLQLHAEPGDGIDGASAQIYWDLDGDNQKDRDPSSPDGMLERRDVTVTGYNGPITMWVIDPVTHEEVTVTKTIDLNAARASAEAEGK